MKTEIQKTELYQQFKKALGINDMRTDDNPYFVECCKIAEDYAKLRLADVSTRLYGLYSIDNELMFVHKTREGAKKHQYEFEKEHGMGFYVDPVIVLE